MASMVFTTLKVDIPLLLRLVPKQAQVQSLPLRGTLLRPMLLVLHGDPVRILPVDPTVVEVAVAAVIAIATVKAGTTLMAVGATQMKEAQAEAGILQTVTAEAMAGAVQVVQVIPAAQAIQAARTVVPTVPVPIAQALAAPVVLAVLVILVVEISPPSVERTQL